MKRLDPKKRKIGTQQEPGNGVSNFHKGLLEGTFFKKTRLREPATGLRRCRKLIRQMDAVSLPADSGAGNGHVELL